MRRALLIAGPTASGKSAIALELARRFDAAIVNADSMPVYSDLRILTARPSPGEIALAPHRLFGGIDGAENFSVGRWLAAAAAALDEFPLAIIVGGTGLYFKALTEGLSAIPHVPAPVRDAVRQDAAGQTTPSLHRALGAVDPQTAAGLRPSDRQRILRALEVFAATARPLASYHGELQPPLLPPGCWTGLFLAPERPALNARIDARFGAMLAAGALEEVERLAARGLDPALPVMRAHGAPHLLAQLRGEASPAFAAERTKLDTRQYARRQFTWARRYMAGFEWVAPDAAAAAGARWLAQDE